MIEMKPKEIKKDLLEMLFYLDRVLEKNNLNYSLAYGTLIGAARHKGFIPWDDDVDIVMPFYDYLKMLTLPELNKEGNRYTVYYPEKIKGKYNYPFAKIMDNNTVCSFKNLDDKGGLFIDVFPMTPLPLNSDLKQYSKKLSYLQNRLVFTFWRGKNDSKYYLHKLSSPLYKHYRDSLKKLAFKYVNEDYVYLTDAIWAKEKVANAVPKEWLENYVELDFDGYKFKAISNYKKWLEKIYGNWQNIPPKSEQKPNHGYRAFYKY